MTDSDRIRTAAWIDAEVRRLTLGCELSPKEPPPVVEGRIPPSTSGNPASDTRVLEHGLGPNI